MTFEAQVGTGLERLPFAWLLLGRGRFGHLATLALLGHYWTLMFTDLVLGLNHICIFCFWRQGVAQRGSSLALLCQVAEDLHLSLLVLVFPVVGVGDQLLVQSLHPTVTVVVVLINVILPRLEEQ